MLIYLDANVLQNLKSEVNIEFLKAITENRASNIYCYSEAHLHDLNRDTTPEKFTDMEFYKSVVKKNCFYFQNDAIQFEFYTPREYYDLFDWSDTINYDFEGNEYLLALKPFLQSLDLGLSETLASLPEESKKNLPRSFAEVLEGSSDVYEFCKRMMGMTNNLSDNKRKDFREMLEVLHGNSNLEQFTEMIGLKGFEKGQVVDKSLFLNSYSEYVKSKAHDKTYMGLFTEMYTGLELYGIVKGKPKNQKFMNFLNDSKHCFYGACCDIIVSEDEDFRNKSNFMYDLHCLGTKVMTTLEYSEHLQKQDSFQDFSLDDFANEMEIFPNLPVVHSGLIENVKYTLKYTSKTLFGYFNSLQIAETEDYKEYFFTKKKDTLLRGVLIEDLQRITNILSNIMGSDLNNNAEFVQGEVSKEKWMGRIWQVHNMVFDTGLNDKLWFRVKVLF